MKSFFTKLGTLLLCGVAVAVVGCTDFSQDIQAGDAALKGEIDKLAEATAENLSKAISGLETQLKADLAALQTTHSTDITKLTAEIEALEKALEAAENAHATDKAAAEKALADLQTALANAKSALETEIASVKAELQKEIDAAEAAAAAGIKANADGVAANKALIDGLTTQLAALEATVDAIDGRLTKTEADVKALQDELAAFKGDYQMFYAQVVNTIQNHANALSTLEADLEAGDAAVKKYVDTMVEELTKKIETVEQTLTSVNNLLDDEVKARVEGDEELNKKIEDTQKALTNVLNLLDDEVKNRTAADKEIQDYIADLEMRLQNKFTVVDNALADLNDGLSDLRKELSEEFASQISVVQDAISSIIIQHNELAEMVNGLDAALKAQTEALQAMKDAYEDKMAELDETDVDLYNQYEKLQEVITTLNNHITDLQAEDEALAASINGVQEALSQYMRVDAEQTAELKKEIEDEILEKFNMLVTLLSATEERLTAKVNHIFDRVIANEIKIADLQEQTAELENAVAALQGAHATLTEQLQNKLTVLDNQIEALQEAEGDNATAIKALQDAHAVLTEQLQNKLSVIDDTIEELTEAIEDNKKAIEKNGASIEANAELIAKNAADIIAANQVVAEFKAAYEVFASNVDYALTNLTTATETNRNDIEGLLENVAEIQETLSDVQEGLTAAIGRIDVLEDAVKALEDAHAALIEGLQNKFTATDKEITDLQDANDALAAELKKAVKELYDNDQKNLDDLSNRLSSHTDKLAKMIYAVEERLGKAEGKIADLEKQTAELENAIKELQDAHALLESNLQQKLTDLDNALAAMDETHKDDVKALQEAHALLTSQLDDAIRRINGQIETLEEAIADNKKAIEANGAAIEDNKELIAENAADILETNTVIAELQAAFDAYKTATDAQIQYLWANDSSIAESIASHTHKIMGIINEVKEDLAKTQEDLTAAIGRIDALEDAVATIQDAYAVLIEGLQNKFGATDKDIVDLQDAIDALEKALAEEVKKLYDNDQKNLDNLSNRLASHTDKLAKMIYAVEERLGKAEGKIADLEKQTAALEEAVQQLKDAHALLTSQLDEALRRVNGQLEQHGEDIDDLKKAHALLTSQLDDAIRRINGQIETLEEAIADNKKAIEKNGAAIEDNKELIAENAADILETNTVIAELQAAFEAYKKATDAQIQYLWNNDSSIAENLAKHTDKLMGLINKTNASLEQTQKDLAAAIGRIDALEEALETFKALAKEKYEALLAKDFELEREIETQTDLLYTAIKHLSLNVSNNANAIAELKKATANADELIKGLRGDVDELLARVQSMVYVPEWDDHKAPIGYSVLNINAEDGNNRNEPVYLMKESVLRYRVHAVAGESDVKAANDIAELYTKNPAAFDYHVEAVKTRAAAEADLEIRNIKAGSQIEGADPKFVYVTVVAKNFDRTFFSEKETSENFTKGYSASLILSDGNNNRSTEYTNLFADKKGDISAYLVNKDGKDWALVFDAEGYFYLPYDDTKTTIEPFKGAYVQFDLDGTKYTEAELKAQGYVFSVTHDGGIYYHEKNATRAEKQIIAEDRYARFLEPLTKKMGFSLPKKSPVTYDGNNAVPSVYFALTSEGLMPDYKATAVELTKAEIGRQVVFIYDYKVNGVSVFGEDVPQSAIEITNRLVKVNFEVKVPWTLETANSTIAGGVYYRGDLIVKGNKFDLSGKENSNSDKNIDGYALATILNAASKKNGAESYNIRTLANDTDKTYEVWLQNVDGGQYAFPANDNDDSKDTYNDYTATYKADFEDITIIVTTTIRLGEQPKAQELSADVEFTTQNGANGWLFGYWDAFTAAYNKFKTDGYLGYVDNEEKGKNEFFKSFDFVNSYKIPTATYPDPLLVNGKPGVTTNANAPFTANNNDKGEHRFQLHESQLANVPENEYVDGLTDQTIQQVVITNFGVPFVFTINGTVNLPDYDLTYDVNRVDDRNNNGDVEKIVNVFGEISNTTKEYTVDVSDLAKYFYVVNNADVKKLERVNAKDTVTVDFTLSHEVVGENKEGGYNFNGVVDDVEHTLAVNWEKKDNYILPMREEFTNPLGAAVVNWGTYNSTEVKVNAVLKVNGFPIVSKPLTLVTKDPLEIILNDAHVAVVHKPGTNAKPIEGKIFQNFVLTSDVEPEVENLFNTEAWTLAGLFKNSKADTKYGVKLKLEYLGVFYDEDGDGIVNPEHTWDESKITLGRYEVATGVYEAGDLNGTVSIKADDGNLTNPIHVRFVVTMEHRIHDRAKEAICERVGTVDVIFTPEK